MKRIVLFLVICSFLTQASIKTAVFINWKINQIKITELYCINKNNPLMHCNGKCYLSLQLKKIESDYQQSKVPFNPKNIKSAEFLLFVEEFIPGSFDLSISDETPLKGGIYQENSSQQHIRSCFRPPNCFSDYALTA